MRLDEAGSEEGSAFGFLRCRYAARVAHGGYFSLRRPTVATASCEDGSQQRARRIYRRASFFVSTADQRLEIAFALGRAVIGRGSAAGTATFAVGATTITAALLPALMVLAPLAALAHADF